MSSILRHLLDSLLLDPGSKSRRPILWTSLWRFLQLLNVQCIRELDGYRIS
jgi:hypothetical protein